MLTKRNIDFYLPKKHFFPDEIFDTYVKLIGDKQCNSVALYRSPSQDQDEFDSFSKNLEITLDKLALNNPFMLVVIGDLNAKSKNWHPSDRTTYEGNIIETITSHFGLH